jgi:HD-GYP domain-containing protein (c-di-GMP phosphodiesterase class II)
MDEKNIKSFEKDLVHLDAQFTLDQLDNWLTTAGLIESALSMINHRIPTARAHLFLHSPESHEYREIIQEGLFTIPEDSLFIACLSMQDKGSSLDSVFTDYSLDEPMLEDVFKSMYHATYVIPIVHRFSLLAFILLSTDQFTQEQTDYLADIIGRLKTNLYAATVADNRQRELLELSEYPTLLHAYSSLMEIKRNILVDIGTKIPFDAGVYYRFDDYHDQLIPEAWICGEFRPEKVLRGKGISGLTLERKRSLFVPDRKTHPSFIDIREEAFIQGSFISVPVFTDKNFMGVITLSRDNEKSDAFGVEHRYMLEILAAFLSSEMSSRLLYNELEDSYFSTVSSLTRALEAKDSYTKGHSERVMDFAVGTAQMLNLSFESVRKIKYAAILHDIGKIGVSDDIITKDSSLTDSEYGEIKKHTEIGYDIINDSGMFSEIKDLVRYHHEKIDGSGYYKKKEGDYPWEAMIISIADIYDALTSDRPYRKAFGSDEAFASLEKLIDIHFDERIFKAFQKWVQLSVKTKKNS